MKLRRFCSLPVQTAVQEAGLLRPGVIVILMQMLLMLLLITVILSECRRASIISITVIPSELSLPFLDLSTIRVRLRHQSSFFSQSLSHLPAFELSQ